MNKKTLIIGGAALIILILVGIMTYKSFNKVEVTMIGQFIGIDGPVISTQVQSPGTEPDYATAFAITSQTTDQSSKKHTVVYDATLYNSQYSGYNNLEFRLYPSSSFSGSYATAYVGYSTYRYKGSTYNVGGLFIIENPTFSDTKYCGRDLYVQIYQHVCPTQYSSCSVYEWQGYSWGGTVKWDCSGCTPNTGPKVCFEGDSYYSDSCGNRGSIYDYCSSTETCTNGACTSSCTSEYEKRCYNDDVYWYDSCGVRGSRYDNCASTETCDPSQLICVDKPVTCVTGQTECADTSSIKECSNGQWVTNPCPTNAPTCQSGSCVVTNVCASETCGNNVCNAACGETTGTCPSDCHIPPTPCPDFCAKTNTGISVREYDGIRNSLTNQCDYQIENCTTTCEMNGAEASCIIPPKPSMLWLAILIIFVIIGGLGGGIWLVLKKR